MPWKRRTTLWPLIIALMLLLALAVDAPRSWQRPESDGLSSHLPESADPLLWTELVLQPELSHVDTLDSLASPVVAPVLPPIEADSYSTDDFDFGEAKTTEQLPSRAQFDFDVLFGIRDQLRTLLGRMPTLSVSPRSRQPAHLHNGVRVDGPNDRLAMRAIGNRTVHQNSAAPADRTAAQQEFTDVLLESVRRSRANTGSSPRLAKRIEAPEKGSPGAHPQAVPEHSNATEQQLEVETQPSAPLLRYRPKLLISELDATPQDSPASEWAEETLELVCRLADDSTTELAEAPQIVAQLQVLAGLGRDQALQLADHATQHKWLRSVQALERRVFIWKTLFDSDSNATSTTNQDSPPPVANVMPVLGEVAARLAGENNGESWREYLLLDRIAVAASEGAGVDSKGRRHLAQEVLSRMVDKRLTTAQKDFVQTKTIVNFRETLRPWAMGPVDLETLAALVELYEAEPSLRFAGALSQLQQRLRWSRDSSYHQLAAHLDQHYRGANMRIALTDDLMNRMMPNRSSTMSPVNERIAGAKVKGQARTTTQVAVRLLPNDQSWQLSLEASGAVYSKTRSQTWPARVQNSAKMFYSARKMILIDDQGMRVSRTKSSARGRNDLVGVDSDFDPVPLVGTLLRGAARRRHQDSRPTALKQVKAKVARQARTRMDQEADPKLHRLEEKFEHNVLAAVESLALVAEPIQMYTTKERAVMELRLANTTQLASHTLRPLAPSDSMASVQMHQSVLNNAAAGLGLNGNRMTLLELHDFLATKFGRAGAAPPADMPTRAIIEFAARDAIRVNCQADRLELVLNIREMANGRDKIRNFAVHAYFRPVIDGLNVRLVRDGTLQFDGRNLRTGPRVVLHSVFGKLLLKNQVMPLLKRDINDPRLEGLMVTQLVIDDGWIGLALGPEYAGRSAWRSQASTLR